MSTNPIGRAIFRILSSVMSVGTPDAFFGHDTQTTPSGAIPRRNLRSLSGSDEESLANRCTNLMPRSVSPSHATLIFGGRARSPA